MKYMAASWRKNDGGRARKLREEAQAQADKRQVEVVKTAIRQFKEEDRRTKREMQRVDGAMHPPPPGTWP